MLLTLLNSVVKTEWLPPFPLKVKLKSRGRDVLGPAEGEGARATKFWDREWPTPAPWRSGARTHRSLLFLTSACWETSWGSPTSVRAWRGWFGRESGREDPAGVPRRARPGWAAPAAANPTGVSAGPMEPTLTTTRAGREFPLELGCPHSPSLVAADLGSCPDADSNFSNFVV